MSEETFVLCPFCAEEVRAQAIKCKHCHEAINEAIKKTDPTEAQDGRGTLEKDDDNFIDSYYPAWHVFGWQIFLGVLLLPLFGIGFVVLIRTILKRHSTKYMIMTKKIVIQIGFLARTTQSFNLNKISSMSVKQTPLQRILKSGDVLLTLPGTKITINNISHPAKFIETINEKK